MSDIEYEGPSRKYIPDEGDNQQHVYKDTSADLHTSYANKDYLANQLHTLQSNIQALINDAEDDLTNHSLYVSTTESDAKLREALNSEWPVQLGPVKNVVTYRYYKALASRDSSAAAYIRSRYEEAARDVTGTTSIDILPLANTILNEALLAQELLTTHVGDLSDSSERRSVELLQDWTESALQHQGNLRRLFQKRNAPNLLPDTDLAQIDPQDASNAQAIFKVNLNRVNLDLAQHLQTLQKNWSEFASVYYRNFLGPALNFRLNVTRNVFPVLPGQVGREMQAAVQSLDSNFAVALADQLRRNKLFDTKMDDLEQTIEMRDSYRSYVNQLASKGTPVPVAAPNTIVRVSDSVEEAALFDSMATLPADSDATPGFGFRAPHSFLSGLDDPNAHPQYLLKSGGNISGSITMNDGVKLDGMSPHLHQHTGLDGTLKIHGEAIEEGSITTGSINTGEKPATPTGLALDALTPTHIPPGVTVFNADLSWDGTDGLTYEVQSTVIGTN